MKKILTSANPYMPLWEHVPDGEPHVFWYNGERRVFVYGSHDTKKTWYCGKEYVTWSAPVNDLTNWTYHGVIYESLDGSDLYAPDVCEKDGKYYLYSAEQRGGKIYVSTADSPVGPFTNPVETKLGFDPGILVDDDGRVYAFYGGFKAFICELESDMATVKEGSLIGNPIEHCQWYPEDDDGHNDNVNGFFEASSPRKVMGKYVYIYSKRQDVPSPELGLHENDVPCNDFLSYAYADYVGGPYTYGGDISFNRGMLTMYMDDKMHTTWQGGNNHGSLCEIDGKYYIFYHRHTNHDLCSRQAMLEPCDVALGKDGKLYIGDITYVDGEPVSSKPVEMTSQGPYVNGIDARMIISAGFACHLYGSKSTFVPRIDEPEVSAPIVGITNGTSVGFRYIQFGSESPKTITLYVNALENFNITTSVKFCGGKEFTETIHVKKGDKVVTAPLTVNMLGKHIIYFIFSGEDGKTIAEFDSFTFD